MYLSYQAGEVHTNGPDKYGDYNKVPCCCAGPPSLVLVSLSSLLTSACDIYVMWVMFLLMGERRGEEILMKKVRCI